MAWSGATTTTDPLVAAFLRVLPKTHVEGRVAFVNPHKNAGGTLAYLAGQKYDLIIMGDNDINAVPAVAFDFPTVRFLLPDEPHEALQDQVRFLRPGVPVAARRRLPRNVEGTLFRTEEAGYLAGYLAAQMETRRPGKDVIGWVGGEKNPGVDRWAVGYEAGARRADPGIEVMHAYSNDFVAVPKCKRAALGLIARGAGVLFNVAGYCGLGTLAAAKERGIWGIGVDSDQSSLGPHILTSAVRNLDAGLLGAMTALERGTLGTRNDRSYGLREGGVGLGQVSSRVPRSILRRLDGIRRQIISGQIEVPSVSRVVPHHS